jgi:hypothetical protein
MRSGTPARRRGTPALLLCLLLLACSQPAQHEKLMDVGEWSLVDHDGRVFRSSSLKGQPALLFFGYTHCPDACPTMMSKVARAYREAGPEARNIPTLFVASIPATIPLLKQYRLLPRRPRKRPHRPKAQMMPSSKLWRALRSATAPPPVRCRSHDPSLSPRPRRRRDPPLRSRRRSEGHREGDD